MIIRLQYSARRGSIGKQADEEPQSRAEPSVRRGEVLSIVVTRIHLLGQAHSTPSLSDYLLHIHAGTKGPSNQT